MNLIRRVIGACALLLCVIGCSKQIQPANNDEYYVEYVFSCHVVQYGKVYSTPYSITFTNSNMKEDTRSYKTVDEEELICGPFKYGDTLRISLEHNYNDNVGGSSQAQTLIDVYVSKNNSPFSLRKSISSVSQEPQNTVLEYTINY